MKDAHNYGGRRTPKTDTNQKALKINLDPLFYGTFAEIGAGQEVARWFFKVGAAAGTISKSMSAYDMAVSDAIYGRCKRYVSRERLQGMLDTSTASTWSGCSPRAATAPLSLLSPTPSRPAIIRARTNATAGWASSFRPIRATKTARSSSTSACSIMKTTLQQEALGIVGVNLLYGAFFLHHKPELMLESLLDNLTTAAHRNRHDRVLRHRIPPRR